MTPLWDIQGWTRDGLVKDALQKAHELSAQDTGSKTLRDLLQEIRSREE